MKKTPMNDIEQATIWFHELRNTWIKCSSECQKVYWRGEMERVHRHLSWLEQRVQW